MIYRSKRDANVHYKKAHNRSRTDGFLLLRKMSSFFPSSDRPVGNIRDTKNRFCNINEQHWFVKNATYNLLVLIVAYVHPSIPFYYLTYFFLFLEWTRSLLLCKYFIDSLTDSECLLLGINTFTRSDLICITAEWFAHCRNEEHGH